MSGNYPYSNKSTPTHDWTQFRCRPRVRSVPPHPFFSCHGTPPPIRLPRLFDASHGGQRLQSRSYVLCSPSLSPPSLPFLAHVLHSLPPVIALLLGLDCCLPLNFSRNFCAEQLPCRPKLPSEAACRTFQITLPRNSLHALFCQHSKHQRYQREHGIYRQ